MRSCLGKLVNAHVSDAVKGEMQIIFLLSVTAGIVLNGLCAAVVFIIEISVHVKLFGKGKPYPFAFLRVFKL